MGFWRTATNIVKGIGKELEKQGNEIKAIQLQFEEKSSSELKKIAKDDSLSNTPKKRAVAVKILKARGDYEEYSS